MVRLPKLGVQRARQEKESRSKSVSVIVISILVCLSFVVIALIPFVEASPEGWSEDIRLTDYTNNDRRPSVAAEGDNIHIVWMRQLDPWQIMYTNSSDGGWSWSNPQQISNTDTSVRDPDIGINGNHIHVVWHDRRGPAWEIYYRNSTDGGLTWNDECRLSEDDGFDSVGPYIDVCGDDIHIVWTDTRHASTEMYYIRSLDGGITWEDGQGGEYGRRLTDTSGDSGPYSIVCKGDIVHAIYGDYSTGSFNVYYMVSYDNGVNWEDGQANSNQGREIAGGTNDNGSAAIAVNGSTVHVVWWETLPGPQLYIWYRNSTDNGQNWNMPVQLVGPVEGRSGLDIDCNENSVSVTWASPSVEGNYEIYEINSTDSGENWGAFVRLTDSTGASYQPKVSLSNDNKYIVWYDERNSNQEIYFKRSPDFIEVPEFTTILIPAIFTIVTYGMIFKYIKWRRKNENE